MRSTTSARAPNTTRWVFRCRAAAAAAAAAATILGHQTRTYSHLLPFPSPWLLTTRCSTLTHSLPPLNRNVAIPLFTPSFYSRAPS
eukprot:188173-Chlamydomonas_euryale.AAC.1